MSETKNRHRSLPPADEDHHDDDAGRGRRFTARDSGWTLASMGRTSTPRVGSVANALTLRRALAERILGAKLHVDLDDVADRGAENQRNGCKRKTTLAASETETGTSCRRLRST
jgi:hypothetical protein